MSISLLQIFCDEPYAQHEVPVSPHNLPNRFGMVEKGVEVAVLKVYWPTYAAQQRLKESLEEAGKRMTASVEEQLSDRTESGEKVRVNVSFSMTKTSEYRLIKNGDRYSLCERGDINAEHFGYYADNDDDAIEVASNYLIRFVLPLRIGQYLCEGQEAGIRVPSNNRGAGIGQSDSI